jgi:hypothetical protein
MNDIIGMQVRLFIAQGRAADAAVALQKFVVEKPIAGALSVTTVRHELLRAEVALAQRDLEACARTAAGIERLVAGHPELYYRRELAGAARILGQVALKVRNPSAAVDAFRRALMNSSIFDPRSPALIPLQLGLAKAHVQAGSLADAQRDVNAADALLSAHPAYRDLWNPALRQVERSLAGR